MSALPGVHSDLSGSQPYVLVMLPVFAFSTAMSSPPTRQKLLLGGEVELAFRGTILSHIRSPIAQEQRPLLRALPPDPDSGTQRPAHRLLEPKLAFHVEITRTKYCEKMWLVQIPSLSTIVWCEHKQDGRDVRT